MAGMPTERNCRLMQDTQEKLDVEELYDPGQEEQPETPPKRPNFFRRRWQHWKGLSRKRKIVSVVVVLLVVLVLSRLLGGGKSSQQAVSYLTAAVERGDITSTLSDSGTLEPADAYTVTSLVSGEVLTADFEEGDVVEKDTLLYSIDSSDSANSIERTQLTLDQAQRNYERTLETMEDLNVKSIDAGTVTELLVEVGDDVTAGQQLAQILGRDAMVLEVPFLQDDAAAISVGAKATVTLESTFEELSGTVTKVSGADVILTGNRIVRYVTIEVENPGALTDTTSATAAVGDLACVSGATLTYKAQDTITAPAAGTVQAIYVKEGSKVGKNQVLLSIQSDDVEDAVDNAYNALRDAEISLDNQYNNYNITSPIQGTVVEKSYKAGDNVSTGGQLCTIYDLSYLTMTVYVDELDIGSVSVGQTVSITADAAPGRTYEGVVTTVSIKGTTSGGVTTYPVTIRIDDTEGLLPGMNADYSIITSQAEDVLRIPAAAVERGDRVLVVDLTADGSDGAPEGYRYQTVTTGITDGDWIEILDGLSEGDTVAYIPAQVGNSLMNLMMGGGMGGNMAIAEPSGGPGGPGGTVAVYGG